VRLILIRHALPLRALRRAGSEAGAGTRAAGGAAGRARAATAEAEGRDGSGPELTELGWRQAHRVVDALASVPLAALYTSPLRRARQTAQPLAEARGLEAVVAPGLAEYDAGAGYYIPVHEMPSADPAAWDRMLAGLLPEYVDAAAFQARVERALSEIVEAHPGEATVACVAHAGTINVYLAALLGLARPLTFPLDYAGVTRVTISRGGRRSVRTINEIAHVADLLEAASASAPAEKRGG
jgi:broad specificity phosphatase PhoE